MDENPYKATCGSDATPMAREPQNETFWTVTLAIGALFWFGSSAVILVTAAGIYDPRTADNLPPDRFGLWCAGIAAEWILGAASTLVAIIKLRRPTDVGHGVRDTIRAWLSFIIGSLVALAVGTGLAALISLFMNP